ncbi:MAG TPA: hypothetical protein VNZ45_12850 [Bacteroidia bacterium]|jgi:hypothetical protein|nr:hypothetical protein [Bacteroidia bacterium]
MATTQIRGNTQIINGTIVDAQINSAAAIATTKLADGALFIKSDGSVAMAGTLNLNTHAITNVVNPTNPQDVATKNYVDATAQGLDVKASCRAVATSNITLTGTQTIDGVALSVNDRVLLIGQSTAAQNGIYTVQSGSWTRPSDANTGTNLVSGSFVFIGEGTANSGSGWVLTTPNPITIGTTSLTFTQFSGAGEIIASTGLLKNGNTLTIDSTVVTLTGSQVLTNKSIVATQLTGTLQAGQFPALTGDVTTSAGALGTTIAAGAVTLAKQANLAANSVIGNITGSSATPTAVSLVTAATASTVVLRDIHANITANSYITSVTTTVTAGSTTTLTNNSTGIQQFTGTTTQTVNLPDATTLTVGQGYLIANRSTGVVTIKDSSGTTLQAMAGGSQLELTLITNGSAAGVWDVAYSVSSAGTVTSISIVSANGFGGSVATATSTPAITLTTNISGLLKGSSSALVAATYGTDYVNNSSFVTRETPSGTLNGSNTAFTLANTPVVGSESLYLNGLLQEPGGNDYTISGTSITMAIAPQSTDRLRVNYIK